MIICRVAAYTVYHPHTTLRKLSTKGMKNLVAVCQLTSSFDKERNLDECSKLLRNAKDAGAKMVFFPENCDYIGRDLEETRSLSEPLTGSILNYYKEHSRSLGIWISLGGLHVKPKDEKLSDSGRRNFNSHVILDDSGEIVVSYNKLHLFDIDLPTIRLKESDFTIRGDTIHPPIDTPIGRLGLATCYDMRFPELALLYRSQGAEVLAYPSTFTVPTGYSHWEVLLRARAIESQCYVIAAAQFGQHNEKRSSYGHAMIVDPWGTVIAQCSDFAPNFCVAEIDVAYLNNVRKRLPCYEHRRTDVYTLEYNPSSKPYDCDESPEYEFGIHKIPSSQVFFRNRDAFAFVNIKPVLKGHVLVASLRKAHRFADLRPNEITGVFSCAQLVQRKLESFYSTKSSTLAIQDGPDAGQTVEHLHIHVIPRVHDDLKTNDEIYRQLQLHDKAMEAGSLRTKDDMADEARQYRTLFSS